MKITIEIDTKDPEQQMELRQIQKAGAMALLLFNYNESLLARISFADELPPQFIEGLSNAHLILTTLCEAEGVDIADLNN
jgi:hypothetical protein